MRDTSQRASLGNVYVGGSAGQATSRRALPQGQPWDCVVVRHMQEKKAEASYGMINKYFEPKDKYLSVGSLSKALDSPKG